MLVIAPVLIGYNCYQDSETGMIKQARKLYQRPNKSVDGYVYYINHFPNGEFSEEAKQSIADYYSDIEQFFSMNVRSRSLYRVDMLVQPEIAKKILERTHNSFDSIDFQIYYVDNKDKSFLGESNIENIGKRRQYNIIERNNYNQ